MGKGFGLRNKKFKFKSQHQWMQMVCPQVTVHSLQTSVPHVQDENEKVHSDVTEEARKSVKVAASHLIIAQ